MEIDIEQSTNMLWSENNLRSVMQNGKTTKELLYRGMSLK